MLLPPYILCACHQDRTNLKPAGSCFLVLLMMVLTSKTYCCPFHRWWATEQRGWSQFVEAVPVFLSWYRKAKAIPLGLHIRGQFCCIFISNSCIGVSGAVGAWYWLDRNEVARYKNENRILPGASKHINLTWWVGTTGLDTVRTSCQCRLTQLNQQHKSI